MEKMMPGVCMKIARGYQPELRDLEEKLWILVFIPKEMANQEALFNRKEIR